MLHPTPNRILISLLPLAAALASCASSPTASQPTPPPGTLAYDKSIFTGLLADHDSIRRTVREIDGGIEATTESDDPAVAARLADHVTAMKHRIETGARVRQWDPLYIAIFDRAEAIHLDIERTAKGVRVRETSTDPRAIALIRSHAGVVTGFAASGFEESAKEHPIPDAAR